MLKLKPRQRRKRKQKPTLKRARLRPTMSVEPSLPPLVPAVFLLTMNAKIVHTRIVYAAIVTRKVTHARHAVLKVAAHTHALAPSHAVVRAVARATKVPAIAPNPSLAKQGEEAVREPPKPKLKLRPKVTFMCLRPLS